MSETVRNVTAVESYQPAGWQNGFLRHIFIENFSAFILLKQSFLIQPLFKYKTERVYTSCSLHNASRNSLLSVGHTDSRRRHRNVTPVCHLLALNQKTI